eukprot:6379189-Amphidinium_carterae.3
MHVTTADGPICLSGLPWQTCIGATVGQPGGDEGQRQYAYGVSQTDGGHEPGLRRCTSWQSLIGSCRWMHGGRTVVGPFWRKANDAALACLRPLSLMTCMLGLNARHRVASRFKGGGWVQDYTA